MRLATAGRWVAFGALGLWRCTKRPQRAVDETDGGCHLNRLGAPRWRDSWYACHMREDRATWKGSRHLGVGHCKISDIGQGSRPHRGLPLDLEQLSGSSRVRGAARSLERWPPAGQGSERWR